MPATHEEVRRALAALCTDDYRRLLVRAQRQWRSLRERGGSTPQELLNQAIEKLLTLEKKWHPARFNMQTALWQAMRNLAGHEKQRLDRGPELVSLDDNSETSRTPTLREEEDPSDLIEADDLQERFLAALEEEPLRQVFELRLTGLTFESIAKRLGLSTATVHRLGQRVTQRWQAFIRHQGGDTL